MGPHSFISALPLLTLYKRFTSINFAKNQLSLSLIGLSPLPTDHPRLLLQTSVRSSKRNYAFFNLSIGRSLSFGSNESNTLHSIHTRVCFASTCPLKQAEFIYSLTHYAKGTPKNHINSLTDCLFQDSGSFSLPFLGFFSLFPHGTCSLSVLTIYLDKEGGPPYIQTLECFTSNKRERTKILDFHHLWSRIPPCSECTFLFLSYPLSFANTYGISVDFFS